MCGIIAVYTKSENETERLLLAGLKEIEHRGPDCQKTIVIPWHKGYLGLGWSRLRITGTSLENDEIPQENGNYLLFNGEIYNFKNLINTYNLPDNDSDVRVLFQGLFLNGLNFLDECEGMFAGIWVNGNSGKIYLFRDSFGIKPLYYQVSDIDDYFKIGSENKNSDSHNNIDLHRYRYKYPSLKAEANSLPKQLLQDSLIEVAGKDFRVIRKKKKLKNLQNRNLIEIIEGNLLQQIPKEVQWGILASGGIDSSVLCQLAYDLGYRKVPLFTLGKNSIHLNSLKKAALRWDFPVIEVVIPTDWKIASEAFMDHHQIPAYDSAAYFTYLCSLEARKKGIKVLLSGSGADELLGGYRRHIFWAKWAQRLKPLRRLAFLFNGKLGQVLASKDDDTLQWYQNLGALPSIYTPFEGVAQWVNPYEDFTMKQAQWWDLYYYLPQDVLVATDRGSMLAGVEVRVPFLSSEMLAFFNHQPEGYFTDNEPKFELKEYLKKSGLGFLVNLPKKGFGL